MDSQALPQLFSQGNPFLAQMGEQEWQAAQQRKAADLASIVNQEQRTSQLHPLMMEHQRANTALNQSTTALNQYALDSKVPVADQKRLNVAEAMGKISTSQRAQMVEVATGHMQKAAVILKNDGVPPVWMQLTPDERKMYSKENLPRIIAMGQEILKYDPKAMENRNAEAARLAQVRAGHPPKAAKESLTGRLDAGAITAALLKLKKASEKVAQLKVYLNQMEPEEAEKWRGTYETLRAQANAELNVGQAGKVDLPATTKGSVKMTPPVDVGPSNTATATRTQRQGPSQADLEFTAKKHGISVEEVKKKLGIK